MSKPAFEGDKSVAASILVVEDEDKLRDLLRTYFEREGMTVLTTKTGAEALTLARENPPDVILLDLGLPDIPGEEVLKEVRSFADVPILVLTAKASEADRILGLELGADDYVTKPFSPRELVLRTRAVLRRGGNGSHSDRSSYGEGLLVMDEGRRELLVRGISVALTTTEWRLLRSLVNGSGRVLSRARLINEVRGYEFDGYERTIDSHIKNLRRKIEEDPTNPQIVQTVVGDGYRFGLSHDRHQRMVG